MAKRVAGLRAKELRDKLRGVKGGFGATIVLSKLFADAQRREAAKAQPSPPEREAESGNRLRGRIRELTPTRAVSASTASSSTARIPGVSNPGTGGRLVDELSRQARRLQLARLQSRSGSTSTRLGR